MRVLTAGLIVASVALCTASAEAQGPPDLSGVWRLVPEQSRMIDAGDTTDDGYQLTWLVDHRDPTSLSS